MHQKKQEKHLKGFQNGWVNILQEKGVFKQHGVPVLGQEQELEPIIICQKNVHIQYIETGGEDENGNPGKQNEVVLGCRNAG